MCLCDFRAKTLVIEMDVPLSHSADDILTMFIQKGKKPDAMSNYLKQAMLNNDQQTKLVVKSISTGEYYLMVKCLRNSTWAQRWR